MTDRGYEKPVVQLSSMDSNVFVLLGACTKALKRIGHPEIANRLAGRVMGEARSYDEALAIMSEYVEVE